MHERPKVLIIDDERDLSEILADYIEDEFNCQICDNSEEALNIIRDKKFDLIISDMQMPKVDGTRIIEHSLAHQPKTPVLILTGSLENDPIISRALEKGAKGVITKPFNSPAEVLNYLKKFCND